MHAIKLLLPRCLLAFAVLVGLFSGTAKAATVSGASEFATWVCTGGDCPWGWQTDGQALVWPASLGPLNQRLGYTVDRPIYLPAAKANGMTVAIDYGYADLYAGLPDAPSHRYLTTIHAGNSYRVDGLAEGEVLSVQSPWGFGYAFVEGQASSPPPPSQQVPTSQYVTWSCTGGYCPWGQTSGGHAIVWPASSQPVTHRLGYTTSAGIYLPAQFANGMEVQILSGSASLYAGNPGAESHRALGTLWAGGAKFKVTGLASDEVLSVQADAAFTFDITRADPAAPGDPADPPPSGGGGGSGGNGGTQSSLLVVWTCGTSPCPWGSTLDGQALVWPADFGALSARLGYLTSAGIYLPAEQADGIAVAVLSGYASAYAGEPGVISHRLLGSAGPGQILSLAGAGPGEVVSVQSDAPFTYQLVPATESPSEPPPPVEPEVPSDGIFHSVSAYWHCDTPGCQDGTWNGAVVSWPSWAAYESNARTGSNSRTVYGDGGHLLYPYMGAWAHGCKVTALSGDVLVIEWQRGTDTWRETWLTPGQTHTINLVAPEDNAMLETVDGGSSSFTVKLEDCTPQQIR